MTKSVKWRDLNTIGFGAVLHGLTQPARGDLIGLLGGKRFCCM